MSVLIYLDSAYIGFIFLVVTEIFLVRVVTNTQIRTLDREVKRHLDEGEPVELDLRDYGPMKVNTRMGVAKIIALVVPAAFVLLMVTLGELGISGRTIPTYATQDTITVGGYFTLDVIETADFERAPIQFSGKWPACVEYSQSSVQASQATITYETTEEGEIELGLVTCSDEVGVVVMDLVSTCYEQDEDHPEYSYFHFNTTFIGDPVYYDSYKLNLNLIYNGETTVTSGAAVVGPCSGQAGGPGQVFWGGYDLLTYEGISKVYYEDINPGHVWKSGGALVIKPVGKRLTARVVV
eukprot:g12694.t1